MGSGRDKRKKLKGTAPGKGAAKTEKKTQANAEKQERRLKKQAAGGEDDVDAILAQLDREQAAKTAVTVTQDAPPPGPRTSCVFQPNGDQKNEEIIMFGGELMDNSTKKVTMYNDLYKYSPSKNRWTKIDTPGPSPRSACCSAIHRGCLYIFGGEYTSPNQEKYKVFRDLWRLDMSNWKWDELKSKSGPSARSGHRMVCYKGKLLMFGGFYDTGFETKYYNDLWEFDLDTLKWQSLGDMSGKWPSARSGFQFVLYGDKLYMYGGYSMKKDEDDPDIERGTTHDDIWCWHLEAHKWERIPKAGMFPSKRASFSMVLHKHIAILFGGVKDEDAKGGEVIISNFFNELYQFNLQQHRWFPVQFRFPKGDKAAKAEAEASARASKLGAQLTAEEAAKHQAATRIQAHYRGHVVRKAYKLYRVGGAISEVLYSPAAYGVDLSNANRPKPRARIHANMAVIKNTLYLFGGIVEIGDKEVTLDDLWKVDLAKLDGWEIVKDNSAGKEDFMEEASDWESDEDEDEDDNEDDLAILPKALAKASI